MSLLSTPHIITPTAISAQEANLPHSIDNQIYLVLNSPQVKAHESLTGEILLDVRKPIDFGCSVVLTIECKERVYSNSQVIYEEVLMSVRSEVFQVKADIRNPMNANVYKIPLNIDISEIFDSSECFKLEKELTVKVDYDLYCQVVQFVDQQHHSQAKMISKINEATNGINNNVNQHPDQADQEGQVLLQSTPTPLQIINHTGDKKSQPVTITQQIPRRQRSFFRSLGNFLCCKGTRENDYKEKESKKQEMKKNNITFFSVDVNTINLYPGEAFSFIINDDSKKPVAEQDQTTQYQARLIQRQAININKTVHLNETKVLFEKNLSKGHSEKITIPYQSLNSYRSNVFRNSYELQVVQFGQSFNEKGCLRLPIHVNPKKFKLIPLKNENEGSEQEQAQQSIQRLLQFPCKIIAKIQLKFDEQLDDQKDLAVSQRSTKLNTPDITPLRRSFE